MMKMTQRLSERCVWLSLPVCLAVGALALGPQSVAAADSSSPGQAKPAAAAAGALVPLKLDLPKPAFKGTPKDIPAGPDIEPYPDLDKPAPTIFVPADLKNLALNAKLTCSDKNATAEMLAKIIDGNKDPSDDSIIFIRKGTQWVQLDLGSPNEVFAIVIWHAHNTPKIYHDVIVQAADDPGFTQNVRTIFNNDIDNTSGQGVGSDREYFETLRGKPIDAKGIKARCFRFYSKGSTESALNEYTEIEIYGRAPAVAVNGEKPTLSAAASKTAQSSAGGR